MARTLLDYHCILEVKQKHVQRNEVLSSTNDPINPKFHIKQIVNDKTIKGDFLDDNATRIKTLFHSHPRQA